jgi:hypothetical protein
MKSSEFRFSSIIAKFFLFSILSKENEKEHSTYSTFHSGSAARSFHYLDNKKKLSIEKLIPEKKVFAFIG